MTKSVYVIKNTINNKVYVGQAINPHRRFIQHLCNGTQLLDNYPIHLAINKYGKENFYYEIIEEKVEDYNEREKYWIEKYNSQCPNGYNVLPGGTTAPVLSGESHPRNTLSNEKVENIIEELLFTNRTQREIANRYGTSERIVNSINKGETHKQDKVSYPIRMKGCHFSKIAFDQICWLLINTDASLESISRYYGLTKGTVAQINRGVTHRDPGYFYPLRTAKGKPYDKKEISILLINREWENVNGI